MYALTLVAFDIFIWQLVHCCLRVMNNYFCKNPVRRARGLNCREIIGHGGPSSGSLIFSRRLSKWTGEQRHIGTKIRKIMIGTAPTCNMFSISTKSLSKRLHMSSTNEYVCFEIATFSSARCKQSCWVDSIFFIDSAFCIYAISSCVVGTIAGPSGPLLSTRTPLPSTVSRLQIFSSTSLMYSCCSRTNCSNNVLPRAKFQWVSVIALVNIRKIDDISYDFV